MLAQLTATQGAFLAGRGRGYALPSAPATGAAAEEAVMGEECGVQSVGDRFRAQLGRGAAAAGAGCTEAGSRLAFLVKAMGKAPSGAMEQLSKARVDPHPALWRL